VKNTSMFPREQKNTIEQILWNQITTVVILKQNIKQQAQSLDNAKLRNALENMCYKNCTKNDIDFLWTCIAGSGPNSPQLNTGQQLTHFYFVNQLNSAS